MNRTYMVHFIKKFKYLDFCLPELESLASIYTTYGRTAGSLPSYRNFPLLRE